MRGFALVFATLLLAATSATEETRPPWQWTLEERFADRFNPAKIREREEAAMAADPRETPGSPDRVHDLAKIGPGHQFENRIDGRRNPELFLPHELFDSLLGGLSQNSATRQSQRKFYSKSLRSLGYDEQSFWPNLESVSTGYLAVKEGECRGQQCSDTRCAARFDALQAARDLFGREEFDRLLYVMVAPRMNSALATLDRNYRENLRRQEMGCR